MPNLNAMIQQGEICQCLRAKTMFYQVHDEAGEAARVEEAGSEGPFWCAHTQSLVGPDGQVADVEKCRPGRACCEVA